MPSCVDSRYVSTLSGMLAISRLVKTSKASKGDSAYAYWGVVDCKAAYQRLLELGAKSNTPVEDVGGGILAATVTDPWGNVFGIIENPHFKLEDAR